MLKRNFQLAVIEYLLQRTLEKLPQVVIDEQGAAQDAHDLEHGSVQLEVMLDNCNKAVRDDCDVDLYPHSILGVAPKPFDAQMLLDPFKEQLHLPAVAVKQPDILGLEIEVVGVVNKRPTEVSDVENDAPELCRVVVSVPFACESDGLVQQHAISPVKEFLSEQHFVGRLPFLSRDEERAGLVDREKPCKVEITLVEHIAGKRFVCDTVHELGVVDIGVSNAVEDRNLRNDVNLCVNFDAGLCAAKARPMEKRHAEVNGGGINGEKTSVQLKFFKNTLFLCDRDHVKSKLLKNTMVAKHVRIGKRAPADRRFAETEIKASFSMCSDYIGEFPETSTAYQLSEHEYQQVVPVGERPFLSLVEMSHDYSSELPLRQKTHDLCENVLPYMHPRTDFGSAAKMQISKPGQGIYDLSNCA